VHYRFRTSGLSLVHSGAVAAAKYGANTSLANRWLALSPRDRSMTPDMAFECLLVSRDSGVAYITLRLLTTLSISINVCLSSLEAFDQVSKGSSDFVISDLEGDAAEVLRGIRRSHGCRKLTVVAVPSNGFLMSAADVFLRRSVTFESGAKSLKAANSRMIYDDRRHARYALMSALSARVDNDLSLDVTITNVGYGGLGLSIKQELPVGETISFHLLLPGPNSAVYIQAHVRWARRYGALGCEFLSIPAVDLSLLPDCLTSRNQIRKSVVEI
jgi:hypothetical protein